MSSRVNRIVRLYQADKPGWEKLVNECSWQETRQLIAAMDKMNKARAPWLLTTLVNLETPSDLRLFRQEYRSQIGNGTDKQILKLRNELRAVWLRAQEEIEATASKWFTQIGLDYDGWLVLPQIGTIRPLLLPGLVAEAALYCHQHFAKCQNGGCNGRLFVASRNTQKYCCLTADCRKYGHNQAAKEYYYRQTSPSIEGSEVVLQ